MPEPVPTRAGNVFRLAATKSPPLLFFGSTKANFIFSSGRRAKRSIAVSARNSFWVMLRPVSAGGATVVVGAGALAVGAGAATAA